MCRETRRAVGFVMSAFLAKSLRWKSSVYLINHRETKTHLYVYMFFPERHEEA